MRPIKTQPPLVADLEYPETESMSGTTANTSNLTIGDAYARCDTGQGDFLHPGSWRDKKPEPVEPEYVECAHCSTRNLFDLAEPCKACGAPLPLEEKEAKKNGGSMATSMKNAARAFRELGFAMGGASELPEPLEEKFWPDPPTVEPEPVGWFHNMLGRFSR